MATNKNKTNKILLKPQQEVFLQAYLDPQSNTWGNALQSAIKAGYSQDYADNIMALMPKWLENVLQDHTLTQKALDNLSDFIGNNENINIKWDATKFVLTTLGKKRFSSQTETVIKFDDEAKEKAQGLIGNYLSNQGDDRNSS